jgi:hypothetical protein
MALQAAPRFPCLGFSDSQVKVRDLLDAICYLRSVDINWIWIVVHRRRATPNEIQKLCKLAQKI